MKDSKRYIFFLLFIIFYCSQPLFSQKITISGKIVDENNNPLPGAHVYFLNSFTGGASNAEGEYMVSIKANPPQILIASMVGMQAFKDTISTYGNFQIDIQLVSTTLLGKEIVVSASRLEENILTSPVSVEKLGLRKIEAMPSANFYDGLGQLKGVDLNVQSLTFKMPNTRGFNGNTNARFNQIIDGVVNVAPGFGFAAGNLFGIPQVDVESIELLTGASSALYGPGGMNGSMSITSKNPFDYQGLSGSVQMGSMNFGSKEYDNNTPYMDVNLRYARVFKDKLGVKFVMSYLKADDWAATDYRDIGDQSNPLSQRWTNPGFNGVNVYGDEVAINLGVIAPDVGIGFADSQGYTPGTPEYDSVVQAIVQVIPEDDVTRTGYNEVDVVNYEAQNLKTSLSMHYKFNERLEGKIAGGLATGQAVYSAQNRFSISDFGMFNIQTELKHDDWFLRAWYLEENSGDAYDAGGAAALINEAWKPSEVWYQDYVGAYLQTVLLGGSSEQGHQFARLVADNRDERGNEQNPNAPSLPLPGSSLYEQLLMETSSRPIGTGDSVLIDGTTYFVGGSEVRDFSSMGQIEGLYNFTKLLNGVNIIAGFQFRHNKLDSDGTVFFDTPEDPVTWNEWGIYAQWIGKLASDRVKFNLSARYDKSTIFEGKFTPRGSVVLSLGDQRNHNIRASAQTAFRFATASDAWVDIAVGPTRVIGGLEEVQNSYDFDAKPLYPLIGESPVTAIPDTTSGPVIIPVFKPETVIAFELGYKSLLYDEKLLIDANIYLNSYNQFHGTQLLVQDPYTPEEQRFQTTVSVDDPITNYGWAMGLDYKFYKTFFVAGNVAYNTIDVDRSLDSDFLSRFNTPEYRFNISIRNRRLTNRIGFNVNFRWQDAFTWESSFGVGEVPSFATLDAQISFRMPFIKSTLRFGGNNILNKYYTTSLGSSQIGALYYVSFTYDQLFR
jgi:outer membrane receptor protein involved in Fe transport